MNDAASDITFFKKYCSQISGDTAAYQTVLALEKKMVVAV